MNIDVACLSQSLVYILYWNENLTETQKILNTISKDVPETLLKRLIDKFMCDVTHYLQNRLLIIMHSTCM